MSKLVLSKETVFGLSVRAGLRTGLSTKQAPRQGTGNPGTGSTDVTQNPDVCGTI
jgi:hypothetical protein